MEEPSWNGELQITRITGIGRLGGGLYRFSSISHLTQTLYPNL